MPTEKKLQIGNSYKKDKLLKGIGNTDHQASTPTRSNKSKHSSQSPFYIKSDDGEKIPVQSYAVWSAEKSRSTTEIRDSPPTTPKTQKTSSKSKKYKNASIQSNAIILKTSPKKTPRKKTLFNMFKGKQPKINEIQQDENKEPVAPTSTVRHSIVGTGSFHTTFSTATEKRSNTINSQIDNNINDIDGTDTTSNLRAQKNKKKKSFLNIIEETDSHSVFSENNDEGSTTSKRTQLSEQIDKKDNDLLCDLISQSSEHQEKKIFKKALSAAESDDDDDNDDEVDESDLLFGDDEEIEVVRNQSNISTKKKEENLKKKDKDTNNDTKFFTKIVKLFSPKPDNIKEDKNTKKTKENLDQKDNVDNSSSPSNAKSTKLEIVNIDLDGIDIISLPALSSASSGSTVASFIPKHRYDRILQTMTPGILVESDFESREEISSKYVAMLMEGYDEKLRWYVKINKKVLDNINVKEQVSEVIMDVPSDSNKKFDDGISLTKMRHSIAKHMQKGELSTALNTLNESLLALLKKRSSNMHSTLGANFHNIGNLKLMLGLYDEAKASYLAAIRARVKKLGDDHPDVVASLHKFGLCLYIISSLDDAQSIFLRTIEKLYKSDDCDERMDQIAKVLNNLACIQFEKGDYVSALKVFQTSLNLLSRDSSTNSLTFATVLCNMSHVFAKRGEVLESSILLEQAISIQKKLLRENHDVVKDTEKSIQYTQSLTKNFKRSKKVTDDLIKSLVTKLPDTQNSQDGKFHC